MKYLTNSECKMLPLLITFYNLGHLIFYLNWLYPGMAKVSDSREGI